MKKLTVITGVVGAIIITVGIGWLSLVSLRNSINNLPSLNSPVIIRVSYVDAQLSKMSLRQKVASLLILHTPGTDTVATQKYLQTYQPGGLIFMGDNIPSTLDELTVNTRKLQSNPQLPYLFAIDEEGGVVKRLDGDNYPAPAELKTQPVAQTESAFRDRSAMLKQVGMNLNFGIVADVTDDPNSFIYPRVFGGDPTAVAARVAAAVKGEYGSTLSTLKHYPGHGETESDSHISIPTTDVSFNRWQQHDEPSFEAGIKAGAEVVMFGHLAYNSVDTLPASLSAKWHTILKNQDGFKGLTITDDMIMLQQSGDPSYANPVVNAISALRAGNTMLLYVLDHGGESNIDPNILIGGIVTAVKNGELDQKIINNNARQVLTLRRSL